MFEFWLIVATLFIILEVVLGFTVVLFFSGLACFTVAALIFLGYITLSSITTQFAAFFLATVVWALVLWKPFKSLIKRISKTNAQATTIIGQEAVIINGPLNQNKVGAVTWSGTIVKARMASDSTHHTLKEGATVKIVAITDNIFIVRGIN